MKNILLLFLNFVLSLTLQAQIPTTLSYQGLLTDANGSPVADGNATLTFKFYKGASETIDATLTRTLTVPTFKGLFTITLGSGTVDDPALPASLGDQPVSIGITPQGGAELSPRAKLATVPYAFRAQSANTMDAAGLTGTITDSRLSTHLQDLADGSLTGSKVGTGISASNVTTGMLNAAQLPPTSVTLPGTIVAYGGTFTGFDVTKGWLPCDGREVSRTVTYSSLFAAIGVSWGTGNNTTTFNVPDLRGKFLRGNDDRATPVAQGDPDAPRVVGSSQTDGFQGHWHIMVKPNATSGGANFGPSNSNTGPTHTSTGVIQDAIEDGSGNGVPRVSSETRPKNASVNYIIKY